MKEETKLIQILSLLTGDGRKQGPSAVEKHLDNPSESWILKGLRQDLIEEITSLMGILHGCEITHETFKNFLLNKEGSSVEESMIQQFLWASHNSLPIYVCAEICRRHIPTDLTRRIYLLKRNDFHFAGTWSWRNHMFTMVMRSVWILELS